MSGKGTGVLNLSCLPSVTLWSLTGAGGDSPQISRARYSDSLFSFRQTSFGSKGSLSGNWIRCLVFYLKLLELEIAYQVVGELCTMPMNILSKLHRSKGATGRYSFPWKINYNQIFQSLPLLLILCLLSLTVLQKD